MCACIDQTAALTMGYGTPPHHTLTLSFMTYSAPTTSPAAATTPPPRSGTTGSASGSTSSTSLRRCVRIVQGWLATGSQSQWAVEILSMHPLPPPFLPSKRNKARRSRTTHPCPPKHIHPSTTDQLPLPPLQAAGSGGADPDGGRGGTREVQDSARYVSDCTCIRVCDCV